MNLFRSLDALPENLRGGAVSVGNFDGVHIGHAQIVARLREMAHGGDGPAVVFTFDPHPATLLHPAKAPPPLTTIERRAELLAQLGVDAVVVYPTDRALLEMEAAEFLRGVLQERLAARAMVEGPNFHFGRNRRGNVALLAEHCRNAGVAFDVVDGVMIEGEVVSSSRIRRLLSAGEVRAASAMLTQPYRVRGMVEHGAERGRLLGFPTANLGRVPTLLPKEGIYAGRAWSAHGSHPAAISLGGNPTFDEGALKFEVHLLDFQGDLYDRPLEVDFLDRLRDIVRFDSAAALVEQMGRDAAAVRRIARSATRHLAG